MLTGAPERMLLATEVVAREGKTEEVAGKTGACKTTTAAGGVGSAGSKVSPTAAKVVWSSLLAGPSAASGVVTCSSAAAEELLDGDGASSDAPRLDFDFLAPLLGEELPEVLADSARIETLAALRLLLILNAADI